MTKRYEPSVGPKRFVRSDPPHHPVVPRSPLADSEAGSRCPRPHCGGLVLERAVVTVDGACVEVYCSACGRSALRAVLEPYTPIPLPQSPADASLYAPDREPGAAQGSDDTAGRLVGLPAPDRRALLEGWTD